MNKKYHGTDPLSEVISDDYRMLQIISRFGISLGFGDSSVAATCEAAGVDVTTFLIVVNFVKDPLHAHISEMSEQTDLPTLIAYLEKSHEYFLNFRLPHIRRKLLEGMDCSGADPVAFLIVKFYDEYMAEVGRHMHYEEEHVHPFVHTLLQGRLPEESFQDVVHRHQDNHSSLEKSIVDLKSIIIKYYPGDKNAALMNDVLMDIIMTEEDLTTHCMLEDTLFAQCVHRLEHRVREERAQDPEDLPADTSLPASSDTISQREKEIIVQVVRGLSNKEIANVLHISVNTVMTHRRNISRKLEIHSAAGLTIYAIVNGLVDLKDVKI